MKNIPPLQKTKLKEYLDAQVRAFNDWIWCFGVDTGINLRDYFTEDELMHIWIVRYAKEFHDNYYKGGKNAV